MRNIRQLDESEVISAICNDVEVIRVNLDKMVVWNLANHSINTIRKDLAKTDYIYFVIEE